MKWIKCRAWHLLVICILSNHLVFGQADGILDSSFAIGGGFDGYVVQALALQPDGKIIVGGSFATCDGIPLNGIARLNEDGSVDATFNPGSGLGGFNNRAFSLALQSDGKIIIGGGFTSINQINRDCIARLNADGTLDLTFTPSVFGFNGEVTCLALQPDGKVVVGGYFNNYNGTTLGHIARLNVDGSLDASFNPTGVGFDNAVLSLALQTDGKIVVGGDFGLYNGGGRLRIARLNANGSLDGTFTPSTIGGSSSSDVNITALAIQMNGKVIVAGNFTDFDRTSRSRIARLNSNGILDLSFDPGTGFNQRYDEINSLILQPDGKVLAGGHFDIYNNANPSDIARISPDGSIDPTFIEFSSGFTGTIFCLNLQSNGSILAGGTMTDFAGVHLGHIARLHNSSAVPTKEMLDFHLTLSPNPAHDASILISRQSLQTVRIVNMAGQVMRTALGEGKSVRLDLTGLQCGFYLVEAIGKTGERHRERLVID